MQAIPSSEEENDESPANEHQQEDHGSPSSLETPKLVLWQGVALLTADCLGVGVLALPHDVKLLGWGLGLGFLIANFPINFFAGNLLSIISLDIEDGGGSSVPSTIQANHSTELEMTAPTSEGNIDNGEESKTNTNIHRRRSNKQYTGVSSQVNSSEEGIEEQEAFHDEDLSIDQDPGHFCHSSQEDEGFTKTYDLISISKAVFENPMITKIVITIYYVSLFLVLGDYILVMARAVSAIFLDQICIPTAGIIASVFMFALCQLKTMTHIGRKVSLASLLAILVVLAQCLFHHRNRELPPDNDDDDEQNIWQQFSAFASIGFAVGSQKLLLNIRHELRHREQASQCLAWSLTTYGTAYFLVIMLAGSNPPSFLFDAIPEGPSRRLAGFLLWGHVAVSYAINCQALCSSIDRFLVQYYPPAVVYDNSASSWFKMLFAGDPSRRWLALTFAVSLTSYLVSNAIPFFKDLVALIGAMASVPLTLTLPALLYRGYNDLPLLLPSKESLGSFALFVFSLFFLVLGLIGAISSIDEDWLSHGSPFSCR